MKLYHLATASVVDSRKLGYIEIVPGGFKVTSQCTQAERISAGYLDFVEVPAPAFYIPGTPRDTITETTCTRDYPNAVLNEDVQLNASLTAVDTEYAGKLLTVSAAIVTCFANDGEDMETKLSELRADYQRILAARDAAFNALFGEE